MYMLIEGRCEDPNKLFSFSDLFDRIVASHPILSVIELEARAIQHRISPTWIGQYTDSRRITYVMEIKL